MILDHSMMRMMMKERTGTSWNVKPRGVSLGFCRFSLSFPKPPFLVST